MFISDCILPVTINDTAFTANAAGTSGGGLRASLARQLSLHRCTLEANSVLNGDGGAISHDTSGSLVVSECLLHGNAASHGGALYGGVNVAVKVNASAFQSNAALQGGGALCFSCSRAAFEDALFVGNAAVQRGGAMLLDRTQGHTSVTGCAFVNNTVAAAVAAATGFLSGGADHQLPGSGGGAQGAGTAAAAVVVDPLATDGSGVNSGAGGAVCLTVAADVAFSNTSFAGNLAVSGGALYAQWDSSGASHGSLTLSCTFFGNNTAAGGAGGALFLHQPLATTVSCGPADAHPCADRPAVGLKLPAVAASLLPSTAPTAALPFGPSWPETIAGERASPVYASFAAVASRPLFAQALSVIGAASASAQPGQSPDAANSSLTTPKAEQQSAPCIAGLVNSAVLGGYGPLLASSGFALRALRTHSPDEEQESDSLLPVLVGVVDHYGCVPRLSTCLCQIWFWARAC